jgi:hypothetical protein
VGTLDVDDFEEPVQSTVTPPSKQFACCVVVVLEYPGTTYVYVVALSTRSITCTVSFLPACNGAERVASITQQ